MDHPFLDPFLKWWTKPTNVLQGRPIQCPPPQLAIYTDASTSGWGAHCSNQSAAGLWSATETTRHLNELELLAIRKAALHFLPLIRGKVVMIHSDNSSAVVYLQNQGHTDSLPMFHSTWEILLECQLQGIAMLVRHIPGRLNVLADGLSRRHQIIGTEWSLHPSIVRQMFSISFIPEMDLFASCHNNKLTAFVSPVPDPRAVALDALSIPWDRSWVYAYPPTALMQRVLHKLVHSDQCRMLLVAPLQHYQPWFPMLLGLLVDFPREVPPFPRLLRQRQLGVFHSYPKQVHLFAWNLSSMACKNDSFLKQLPTVSARQLEHLTGIYDCKWRVYETWCHAEQISPLQATVQQLAEFLEFPFLTRKLTPSAIKGYRSAISTVFQLQGGWNAGTHPILSSLLRAFDIEQPRSPLSGTWLWSFRRFLRALRAYGLLCYEVSHMDNGLSCGTCIY